MGANQDFTKKEWDVFLFFMNWTKKEKILIRTNSCALCDFFCHPFPTTAQASHNVEEEISSASSGRKKENRHVRVSYCEERKEWQWERASVIWCPVICVMVPRTQNMLRLKEMERGRERENPSNPSGILMLLFRPRGDFRDRRWAWKGITAKPFHWFQKICSKLLWEQTST